MRRRKLPTASGFRLIRAYTTDHNLARFRKHVERLQRRLRVAPASRRVRLKSRRLSRGQA